MLAEVGFAKIALSVFVCLLFTRWTVFNFCDKCKRYLIAH